MEQQGAPVLGEVVFAPDPGPPRSASSSFYQTPPDFAAGCASVSCQLAFVAIPLAAHVGGSFVVAATKATKHKTQQAETEKKRKYATKVVESLWLSSVKQQQVNLSRLTWRRESVAVETPQGQLRTKWRTRHAPLAHLFLSAFSSERISL